MLRLLLLLTITINILRDIKLMGLCCEMLFRKEEYHYNESRIKMLEQKIAIKYNTIHDNQFTYYLRVYVQRQLLDRIMLQYKEMSSSQPTDTSSFKVEEIKQEIDMINRYLCEWKDQNSNLRHRISEDRNKIISYCKKIKLPQGVMSNQCMIKLQIQGIEVVSGIDKITIQKQSKIKFEDSAYQNESISIHNIKKQPIYRQIYFPIVGGTRIKIITQPLSSSITIDVEDIFKYSTFTAVFGFKKQSEDYGFVALRMQFISSNQKYHESKNQELQMLEKELRLCLEGKQGFERLSSYRSDTNSIINTFLSDPVSEYYNQYRI